MKSIVRGLITSSLLISFGKIGPVLATSESADANGKYFSQLNNPSQDINTGIQYWIELKRDKDVSRVNNKTVFLSGDRIRFHVKSNIDGYGYIILRSGSGGEEAVLFPDSHRNDDNRVEHGKEYVMPSDGALQFNQNPGIEKLSLLLSRSPIDTKSYEQEQSTKRTFSSVATIAAGSKDLIPTDIVVSYAPSCSATNPDANVQRHSSANMKNEVRGKKKDEDHFIESPMASNIPSVPAGSGSISESGVTTIVHKSPSGVLAVDISLEHR